MRDRLTLTRRQTRTRSRRSVQIRRTAQRGADSVDDISTSTRIPLGGQGVATVVLSTLPAYAVPWKHIG